MSDPPTQLSLPPTLPYPITITRLLVSNGTQVKRGSPLLEYSFLSKEQRDAIAKREKTGRRADTSRGEVEGNDRSGTWDCLIEGEVVKWENWAAVGTIAERRQAGQPLLNVFQPCSHPVQLHGMCGICGADLTEDDYLSIPAPASISNQAGPSRHPGGFEVTHDSMGVTVSKNEAERLDNLTRDALLSTRRLSLIVDLDQTIIHTTVDPTVAEWMEEIEFDQSYNNVESSSPSQSETRSTTPPLSPTTAAGSDAPNMRPTESTTPPTSPHIANLALPKISPPRRSKEKNPNAVALKDVAKFQIADDLPPGYTKPRRRPGQKWIEMQGRWYFTKPRPGLQKFLDEMSELYEMHVYTMGTRSYADAICNVIDPDGRIFGGRILSRDESGSFSSKNLKRLFPTDTSMVVVIDDRSDVWADCPNLVKVVPYDFFVGIGDINSSFLPKNKSTPPPSPTAGSSQAPSPSTTSSSSTESTPPPATPEGDVPSVEDGLLLKAKLLDDLSESRPLAKMQEQLEHDTDLTDGSKGSAKEENGSTDETIKETSTELNYAMREENGPQSHVSIPTQSTTPPKQRKPILNPNDYELIRVSNILREVHNRFYRAYDSLEDWSPEKSLPMSCDVEFIIPELKSKVLEGCNLVFSGLIPQSVNPENTEIWQMAETFGALCSLSLHPRITHCVTAILNTEKTYRASKLPDVKIVWANWFWDSVALWHRQREDRYLAKKLDEDIPSMSSTSTSSQIGTVNEGTSDGEDENDVNEEKNTGDGEEGGNADEHEDMDDDQNVGTGWDEGADAEWEAFMAEDDDEASERGSIRSIDSVPSTPSKKRVRYADEESLPLEVFKDPSPTHPDDPAPKRRKPLLLEAPAESDLVPEQNRFEYKVFAKGKAKPESQEQDQRISAEEPENEIDAQSIAGTEGTEGEGTEEDEFAMMLMDSLANDEEAEEDEGE
ncbi:uncharacterized protein IL334_007405 [Kwoniella shivajii]|uniref:RNA polymerase II subunit A C-terminal domain phosphatase n=1 Tax=Kwoniella shivajii TaxID=564305 RepID=A0ABZ1DCJ0_9TREE|nr:hypothetical protein IL334_007405 [Kwoniella shivajii]